ncbi:unnamed protein product [Cylindrotheca closterium]|uniref:Uncharacterized protein n=1 Tax=Cylindrotheca closterium TaxID=2856 RepID=A0AAD2CQN7_9STRA|nr:unnamed protein product [Cylindrotheca closterium]
MTTFGTKSTRRNIKDDLKTAEQRRQGGQRQALMERNRAKFSSPLNAGPFVYNPSPSPTNESSTSSTEKKIDLFGCSHLAPFSEWYKTQYGCEPSDSLAIFLKPVQDVTSASDCLDDGDQIEAEMMETYLSLHPYLELTANHKADASMNDLAKRFSSLSINCNAMEVDEDEMDIDLPEIDWMQVDIDEMEVDCPYR